MEPDVRSDIAALLDELDRAEREVEELVGGLSEEQLNWQPATARGGTGWSVGQAVEHIAVTNDVYMTAVVAALTAARARAAGRPGRGRHERRGPIRLPWFSRWFVGQLEPPPKTRLKAFKAIQPPSTTSRLAVLSHFRAAQANVRGHLRENANLDLNAIRFKNPFLPLVRFTCGTAFHIVNAHARRHLWQARRVLSATGFPTG